MADTYQISSSVETAAPQQGRLGPWRSWVEISLTALRHNFRTISNDVQTQATICAVLKSEAYGHGAVPCAIALQAEGASWFAVNTASEGILLRKAGITGRILLLDGVWPYDAEAILENDLTAAVWNRNQLLLLDKAGSKLRQRAAVHLKVNTGLNRLGADWNDFDSVLRVFQSAEHIHLEGIFSHFSSSEVVDDPQCDRQLSLFHRFLKRASEFGMQPAFQHMANSSAIYTWPDSRFNMVRPGISLFGYYLPLKSSATNHEYHVLRSAVIPVLSWKTRIVHLRNVLPGQGIGYGGEYITRFPTRVAVLSVGYSDGLSRRLSSGGRVIVHDCFASIIGNISMNLTTVDVTGIPDLQIGDEVILIGRSGSKEISASEHAELGSTIPYEVLCGISSRLPREYLD